MSQTSSFSPQAPHPMKKKVIAAVVAVVMGHMGALWALSHMKTPELKPVEKEPLKVRFVEIQKQPKPEPPKPKTEPKKETPPPPPKKEVKIVETPPPKQDIKVEQVKKPEAAKPVTKPVDVPPPKPQPTPVVEKPVVKPVVEKPAPVVAPTPPAPKAEPAPPAPKAEPAPPAPKADPAPAPAAAPQKEVIIGAGVQWSRSPKPQYTNKDLQGETRQVVIHIEADEKGVIKVARVTKSSGIPALDEKIRRAVMSAKFKPYKENGIAYPISASQPFELTLSPNG